MSGGKEFHNLSAATEKAGWSQSAAPHMNVKQIYDGARPFLALMVSSENKVDAEENAAQGWCAYASSFIIEVDCYADIAVIMSVHLST